jgi:tRNA threonylcarbamoyl adenosine modification protein YeaZ
VSATGSRARSASEPAEPAESSGWILVFDTATTLAVVGLGTTDARLVAQTAWSAGYRHGEELLARIDRVLAEAGVGLDELGGIVVGTGPGAFTGLRVGLATAKGLAHGLGIQLVGVPTGLALAAAAGLDDPATPPVAGLLPAGPSDRILIDPQGRASLVPAGTDPALDAGWLLFAIDLPDRAPDLALALGTRIRGHLVQALLQIGAARLGDGLPSDLATLVPEYVTLPRGVREMSGSVAWSRDPS